MEMTANPPKTGRQKGHAAEPASPDAAASLSRLELQCMKALWQSGATTVREVQQALLPARPLAYTTILTVLDRLHEKGAVQRIKKGKAYLYTPAISFDEARQTALQHLIEFYFEGAAEKLQEHMAPEAAPPTRSPSGWPDLSEELL